MNRDDLRESRPAGTRSCAGARPARWQRGGRRNQRRKRATARVEVSTGSFWTATHVDHLMSRDGKSEESLVELFAVRTLAARRNCQTALRSFLRAVQKRTVPVVTDGKIDNALVAYSNVSAWFIASCCSDGSLAVIPPLWFLKTSKVSSMLEGG